MSESATVLLPKQRPSWASGQPRKLSLDQRRT